MTDELKPYVVLYDYNDVPTVRAFANSDKRVRCIMGPFGCLSGDSKILTERGPVPISDINQPMRVLSWNKKKNRFELSLSGGAFPKGSDYLYRVITRHGEFVAAGHHRVLGADDKYQLVENLLAGDSLSLCSTFQIEKFASEGPLSFPVNVLSYNQIILNSMGRYAKSARQYGRRLLQEANIYPAYVPLRDDVQRLSSFPGCYASLHMDGYSEPSPEHIRHGLYVSQTHTCDSSGRPVLLGRVDRVAAFEQLFSRILERAPQFLQPLLKFASHRIKKLLTLCFRSFSSSSLSNGAILSIERLSVKQSFWDMQVLGTNNYVTIDGAIHHNSGKSSGCVMEIIKRAKEQVPGPDGIRRSRWAVVRNTYNQLKDTTIRTFHDWFPPKVFGEYRITDHNYIITKFPGVHLEIFFRALDRPDQVANLLSLEITGAFFNEAREIPKTIIEAMDARIGRYPSKRDGGASWYGMIMDTNPPDEDSYLYKTFENIRPDTWVMFKQPSGLSSRAENLRNLPKNYYVNLAKGKDPMYIRIYIHGQYGYLVVGKPVWESYVDSVHVAPHILEPNRKLPLVLGFDFGLQPTCPIGQITPLGQLRILDELVSEGMGLKQFCENQLLPLLRLKYFGMEVVGYGDPAGTSRAPTDESTCFEVLHSPEVGLSGIQPAPTNALTARISSVEVFLNKMYRGDPSFLISPNCHFLRKAMNGGYHYAKKPRAAGEEWKPIPEKNFSCVDYQTEILTFDGWKHCHDLHIGQEVFGFKNNHIVKDELLNIYQFENAPVLKVENKLDSFVFTESHRCLVIHGRTGKDMVVEAKDLNTNQVLVAAVRAFDDDSRKRVTFTDQFIKICAWVQTEGTYRKDGSIVVSQSTEHNPQYVEEIDKLLFGYKRALSGKMMTWKITREIAYLIRKLMPNKYPSVGFALMMKNSQKRLYLYECLRGDGHNGGPMPDCSRITRLRDFWLDRRYTDGDYLTPRVTAKSKESLDVLQMMCVLLGMKSFIRHSGSRWIISFIKKTKTVSVRTQPKRTGTASVWCPTTRTGFWVMRRNGAVLITGNSHIADGLQMLCMYLNDKERDDTRFKEFLAQIAHKPAYQPGSSEAGY